MANGNIMIRKWEWLREYCKRQGFDESAEIADQIDRVLCYLYGEVDTKAWEEYVTAGEDWINETGEIKLGREDVVYGIVENGSFCVACGRVDCDSCEFGSLVGRCDDEGSLFVEFRDRYNVKSE